MTDHEKRYSLHELEDRTGVRARTIQYYIRERLLPRPEGKGSASYYTEEHLLRLRLIDLLSQAGISLETIRSSLEDWSVKDMRRLVDLAEGREISDLTTLSSWLTVGRTQGFEDQVEHSWDDGSMMEVSLESREEEALLERFVLPEAAPENADALYPREEPRGAAHPRERSAWPERPAPPRSPRPSYDTPGGGADREAEPEPTPGSSRDELRDAVRSVTRQHRTIDADADEDDGERSERYRQQRSTVFASGVRTKKSLLVQKPSDRSAPAANSGSERPGDAGRALRSEAPPAVPRDYWHRLRISDDVELHVHAAASSRTRARLEKLILLAQHLFRDSDESGRSDTTSKGRGTSGKENDPQEA